MRLIRRKTTKNRLVGASVRKTKTGGRGSVTLKSAKTGRTKTKGVGNYFYRGNDGKIKSYKK